MKITAMDMSDMYIRLVLVFGLAVTAAVPVQAQDVDSSSPPEVGAKAAELLDQSLEDLLTLESTSVAKKRQRVADSAAAVYIITQEDIRRSGADTIPDLLRGVPGVEVARQANGGYAISVRGFNSRLSSSLLVMVDGRSQFVSMLSGVFWDQLQIPLGDIERIEIVRGPGSALWGSNSANGVINIITRHSADTGGLVADVRAGTRTQQASLSYGGRVDEDLSYRIYGNLRNDNGMVLADGSDLARHWRGLQTGARIDWEPDSRNALTAQLNYGTGDFHTQIDSLSSDPFNPGYVRIETEDRYNTFDALVRWAHEASSDELNLTLQAQYNRISRREFNDVSFVWQLADLDLGIHWQPDDTHDISVGVSGRLLWDSLTGSDRVGFAKPSATDKWLSGYLQDDITLVPDIVRLTLGTKLEYNNFTGVELQPGARLLLQPQDDITMWAAFTRAIRTPSRFERSARFNFTMYPAGSPRNPSPLPVYPVMFGTEGRAPESVTAYEAGLRLQLIHGWSLDAAGYYNRYNRLTVPTPGESKLVFAPGVPFPVAIDLVVPLAGRGQAKTWGVEATLAGAITPDWGVELNLSHFDYRVADDPMTGSPYGLLFPLQGSPHYQIALRSNVDVTDRIAFSSTLRHVSATTGGVVPAYTELDARLSWQWENGLEVSVIGTNLLHARHAEFTQPSYPAPLAYVPRSVSAQLRYRF